MDRERAEGKVIRRTKEAAHEVGRKMGMGTSSSLTPVSHLNLSHGSLFDLSPQFTFNPERFENSEEEEDWCLDKHREKKKGVGLQGSNESSIQLQSREWGTLRLPSPLAVSGGL